jgi:hypothetical protein
MLRQICLVWVDIVLFMLELPLFQPRQKTPVKGTDGCDRWHENLLKDKPKFPTAKPWLHVATALLAPTVSDGTAHASLKTSAQISLFGSRCPATKPNVQRQGARG